MAAVKVPRMIVDLAVIKRRVREGALIRRY